MPDRPTDNPPSPWAEERPRNPRITGRLLMGLAFLWLGVLWTLDNLGFLDADVIVRWWPLLVIVFGLAKLFGLGARQSTFAAVLWLLAGTWLMLHELGIVRHGITGLWPLALVLIGGRIIMNSSRRSKVRRTQRPGASSVNADDHGRVKVEAVMAGVERRFRTGVFGGGEVLSIMANVELDLREATLGEARTELEVNAVLGGIVLRVPRGWTVINEATPVMGAIEDHTEPPAAGEPGRDTLILRGAAVMGGVEIRN
jgi:hypothetical protein